MTGALGSRPPAGGWTTDHLEAMPEDGRRRELLDGVLLVSPSPTDVHQIIAMRLGVALEQTCPPDLQVTQGVEVRISNRRSFIPDVLVATDEAARRRAGHYAPHEVVLAVEIVSPTSQSMDRITKPALYAAAGIPFFWRIETAGGITVHASKIDPEHEVYQPFGTFSDVIDVPEPWAVKIPVNTLTPRHL
ncbi:Uma2 family endonuclease [Krasilnikovia cinnamomea]|uniref:Uma2 family endonuclease n=1 Tax=Krasilnikovia cinnamomea TaxID=349313 RepID=A0A4Q7ZMN6_9ACTN|nr:Uma2 family endonuclease [Krasilnikovia cinnamomea]RZU51884.1 Uma2 family endonuclease [Krasilnikovia cinnamomea]